MKLHLGCWKRNIPGFTNVDVCDEPHIDHRSNIDSLPFIQDNCVKLIYCSHAFEYFDRIEAQKVLLEWKRVLIPGGELRLAVPDFNALIEVYRLTGDITKVLGPLYGRMNIVIDDGHLETIYHKTVYDELSLENVLREAGFVNPVRWDWRKTEHADIDDHSQAYYPHMKKDGGLHLSLNIACFKPL
jgi:predicted SAM-dependent methyltransferase